VSIKILYIVSTLRRCGPTNQLYGIVKYLDRNVFKPYLVTLSPDPDDSRWDDFAGLGIELDTLGLSRIKGIFFAKNELNKRVACIQPDIIHSQGIRADVFASKLKVKIPKVCTIRNFPQEDYKMTYGTVINKIMVSVHRRAMKRIDLCIGVSNAVSVNLKNNFGITNTIVIQNGVDTEHFYPVDIEIKKKLRAKLGLPTDKTIWISVGHLSERKDPVFLIKVWKKLFAGVPDKVLIFIGDGPLSEQCRAESFGCNNIIIKGRVTSASEYLQASDFFISSSKAEGLPNAVIEAMACGLPCVLSDIGPHREIHNLGRQGGVMFELNSANSLADAINLAVKRDYSLMREVSLKTVREHLSAADMSRKYQSIYTQKVLQS